MAKSSKQKITTYKNGIEPEDTNVRVSMDIKNRVKEHVGEYGGKVGKFFEIAAAEKIERDSKK